MLFGVDWRESNIYQTYNTFASTCPAVLYTSHTHGGIEEWNVPNLRSERRLAMLQPEASLLSQGETKNRAQGFPRPIILILHACGRWNSGSFARGNMVGPRSMTSLASGRGPQADSPFESLQGQVAESAWRLGGRFFGHLVPRLPPHIRFGDSMQHLEFQDPGAQEGAAQASSVDREPPSPTQAMNLDDSPCDSGPLRSRERRRTLQK